MSNTLPYHTKYRPSTLERIIGHEKVVTRLQGIIKQNKVPNALLFVGPSSAGKTTLARAFSAALHPENTIEGSRDYTEINGADTRGIDDVRDLLRVAKLKPGQAKKRIILIDEAQQLTGPSAQLLLKPLENPPPSTLFIICSMEPEKLLPAIKNRCSQFVLEPQSEENLLKFVRRISKAEAMAYVTPEIGLKIARSSNGEMRSAANILEALKQYVDGLDKTPKELTEDDIEDAISTTETADEMIAVKVLIACYTQKFKVLQKALLDVQDYFRFINVLVRLNSFMLNSTVLDGAQHKLVWYSQQNKDLEAGFKKYSGVSDKMQQIHIFSTVQAELVALKTQSSMFLVPELNLISAKLYEAVLKIKALGYATKEK